MELNKNFKRFLLGAAPMFITAIIIGLGGLLAISISYPTPTTPLNLTWEGILMFMGIAAGIGWIIHGTGFLLVRVS